MNLPRFEQSTILTQIVHGDTDAPRGGAAVWALLAGVFAFAGILLWWVLA